LLGRVCLFFTPAFAGFFVPVMDDWKESKPQEIQYLSDFEAPKEWEEVRDEDGNVVPGCYRTIPASTEE
jgi:hypothetical protein